MFCFWKSNYTAIESGTKIHQSFFLRKWYNEEISYLIKIDIVYNFADLTLTFKVQQNMTYLMFLLFVCGKPSIHQYRVFSETYLSIFGRQVIE